MSFTDISFGAKSVLIGRAEVATSMTAVPQDRLGFDEALITIVAGAIADTRTVTINIQSSDTSGGSYATITGGTFVVNPETADNTAPLAFHVDLRGAKRWIQATATVGGSGNFTTFVVALFGNAKYTPDFAPKVTTIPTPAA
jgi:hypothetical protein